MKNALLLLLLVSPVAAWEIEGNPDKIPSIGVNYHRKDLDGSFKMITFNSVFNTTDGVNRLEEDILVDARLPLFSFMTLSLGGGYSTLDIGGRDTTVSCCIGGFLFEANYPTTQSLTGYTINAGVRFYLK